MENNKERMIKQLFVGKVADVIGIEKTFELLKDATDVVNEFCKLDNQKTATTPYGDTIWLKAQETSRSEFEQWFDNLFVIAI